LRSQYDAAVEKQKSDLLELEKYKKSLKNSEEKQQQDRQIIEDLQGKVAEKTEKLRELQRGKQELMQMNEEMQTRMTSTVGILYNFPRILSEFFETFMKFSSFY
jgi:predicted transcriptional regulator